MNSSPEPPVYIPVESYCATNLLCPFQKREHLKTGNWLKKFSIVHLKNRKLVKEIFYCALQKV